jgi:hypothetical protein
VKSEGEAPAGELHQETALNVESGLVHPRPLRHQAEPEPVGGSYGSLEPGVEKLSSISSRSKTYSDSA